MEKCSFHQPEVTYLGYILSAQGISMDPEKVAAFKEWPVPTNCKEIQRFVGFSNFYRRFIPNFSSLTLPLTNLLKKGVPYVWNSVAQESFDELKTWFTTAPILKTPDQNLGFIIETDA
ncbi:uncharacterized protein [Ambystoma mexicanum]|uniref:uncharacterized protein n=1 Tax=Ambystoma mexicanum TaxID=8296 RepID=UPI0037E7CFBA